MNSAPRVTSLQSYRLMTFRRALHPELFQIRNRRTETTGRYDLETWVGPGAHMVRFQYDGHCLAELVTPDESPVPEQGLLVWFPCAGERDYEEYVDGRVKYITSVQSELLSDHLYKRTLDEMQDYASVCEAQWYRERVEGQRFDSLSILEVETMRREVNAQSWHFDATCGLVVRTQVVFELIGD